MQNNYPTEETNVQLKLNTHNDLHNTSKTNLPIAALLERGNSRGALLSTFADWSKGTYYLGFITLSYIMLKHEYYN